MKIPHPIPYQGSKRNLAHRIVSLFPPQSCVLYEPFAGSAAVSILSAYHHRAERFHLNDINQPLIRLLEKIVNNPHEIADEYEHLWRAQDRQERTFYDEIRSKFNKSHQPAQLLYLLARCVKASVRYNYDGDFNQSPDNRRKGRKPALMRSDIVRTSHLLKGKVLFTHVDYHKVLAQATSDDIVYLDPPYQGTFDSGGFRYFEDLDIGSFVNSLRMLNKRHVPFILSFDGRTGSKRFGNPLPDDIGLKRFEIRVGKSSQATLLGRTHYTYESLYLSKSLVEKRGGEMTENISLFPEENQMSILAS